MSKYLDKTGLTDTLSLLKTWIAEQSTAAKASKLSTARKINNTAFDGSSDITTSLWGTARTLTIGSTGKSVNGSANVSWSLDEIGAAAKDHTHTELTPYLTGGTAAASTSRIRIMRIKLSDINTKYNNVTDSWASWAQHLCSILCEDRFLGAGKIDVYCSTQGVISVADQTDKRGYFAQNNIKVTIKCDGIIDKSLLDVRIGTSEDTVYYVDIWAYLKEYHRASFYLLGKSDEAVTPLTDWTLYENITAPTDETYYTCNNVSITSASDATSATKLTSSAGSATVPVYFKDGKPVVITSYSGNSATVSTTATAASSTTEYYVPYHTNNSGSTTLRNNASFKWQNLTGTTSTPGYSSLFLGNATAKGTAGNAHGSIRLYGDTAYYTIIKGSDVAASHTLTLPLVTGDGNVVGTNTTGAVGSATQPVYIAANGVATAGTSFADATVKKATSADSATKATQDGSGNTITSTYIKGLSVSGKTITYTKGDDTTDTITTQDTTYTSLKNPYSLTIQGNGTTLTNGVYDGSAAKTVNITKSSIGLGSVENTALSTWAGTNKITTLGTVTTGTWNGSTVDVAHGGTGATTFTSGAALIGNGTGAVTTRSILNNTDVGALKSTWSNDTSLATINTLAYWNGAYSGTSSNLAYCAKGAFGDIVTHNASEFVLAGGSIDSAKLLTGKTIVSASLATASGVRYIKILSGESYAAYGTLMVNLQGESLNDQFYINVNAAIGNAPVITGWCNSHQGYTGKFYVVKGATWNSTWDLWLSFNQKSNCEVITSVLWGSFTAVNTNSTLNCSSSAPTGSVDTYSYCRGFFGRADKLNVNYANSAGTSALLDNGASAGIHNMSIYYGAGSKTLTTSPSSSTVGYAYAGSSNVPQVYSYPSGATGTSSTVANIQNIRVMWDGSYWHDFFMSPNYGNIYHRSVINGTANNWETMITSGNISNYANKTSLWTSLTSLAGQTVSITDFMKSRANNAGMLYTNNNWAWANQGYIKLNNSISVNTERYAALSLRHGSIANAWSMQAFLFVPVYADDTGDSIFLARATVGSDTSTPSMTITQYGSVSQNDSRYALASHTHSYAGSSSAGGAANSATKLATARTLTIGNTGKTFDGSGNVSWSLSEIGAMAASPTSVTITASTGYSVQAVCFKMGRLVVAWGAWYSGSVSSATSIATGFPAPYAENSNSSLGYMRPYPGVNVTQIGNNEANNGYSICISSGGGLYVTPMHGSFAPTTSIPVYFNITYISAS